MSLDIETEIEPPDLPPAEDNEPLKPSYYISCNIAEVDGTHYSSNAVMPADCSDAEIAEAFVKVLHAAAGLRSPGLGTEVRKLLKELPNE